MVATRQTTEEGTMISVHYQVENAGEVSTSPPTVPVYVRGVHFTPTRVGDVTADPLCTVELAPAGRVTHEHVLVHPLADLDGRDVAATTAAVDVVARRVVSYARLIRYELERIGVAHDLRYVSIRDQVVTIVRGDES